MHPLGAVAIVLMFLAMDAIIVSSLMRAARDALRDLARGRAPVEPGPGAVRKEFQSFKIGIINLGYSIHVAVDASYLHLYPSLTARWIGMAPMSIPWEEIRVKRVTRLSGVSTMIGKHSVSGPKWCMAMAADPAGAQ